MQLRNWTLTVLVLCATQSTGAAQPVAATPPAPLPEFQAHYSAYKGSLRIAESVVRLQRSGSKFVYSSVTEPVGLLALFRHDEVTERSVWQLHNGGIRPLEYQYVHKRSDKDRNVGLVFDWQHGEVANTAKGHTWTMDVPKGTQDKFSVQLAVMLDLQRGDGPLRYDVADGGKLKQYRFRRLGTEHVQIKAGEFETVKLQRLRRQDNERETYFWCAPALHYLVVRLEHIEEDGSQFYMELDRIERL